MSDFVQLSEFVADGLLARAESYRYPLRDYLPPRLGTGAGPWPRSRQRSDRNKEVSKSPPGHP
jgi:hypothetical protein